MNNISRKIDNFFYDLTFAPFMAAFLFFSLTIAVVIQAFDPYNVLRYLSSSMILLGMTIAAFRYVNIYKIPYALGTLSFLSFFTAMYKVYHYYFILHPIDRYRSTGLFESQEPQLLVIFVPLIIFFSIMGTVYLALGIKDKLENKK